MVVSLCRRGQLCTKFSTGNRRNASVISSTRQVTKKRLLNVADNSGLKVSKLWRTSRRIERPHPFRQTKSVLSWHKEGWAPFVLGLQPRRFRGVQIKGG